MTNRSFEQRPPLVLPLLGWAAVAALLSAGAGWAVVAGAGSTGAFEDRDLSVDAVLDLARRRLTVLRAARSLPGFGKRARRASSDVFDAAVKALEAPARRRAAMSPPKVGRELGHALLAMDPRQAVAHGGRRRLCRLGQLATLGDLDAQEHDRLAGAALGAAILGRAHRSAWLQERILAGGVDYSFQRRRLVGRLAAANYHGRTIKALRRFIAEQKDSRARARLQHRLCAQLALAGRDREAAALPRSGRCQAVRAWQAALSGRHAQAVQLAGDLGAPSPLRVGGLLLRLAVYAEAGRWTKLAALYRRRGGAAFSLGDPHGEPLKFFNDIYSPPLPLSLTRRLIRRVEARLGKPVGELELSELLPRLLFIRGRQLLLAGRPRRAQALWRRVRRIAPDYRPARVAWVRLLELLEGPGPALAALREQRSRAPQQEATYLALLGRHREARRALKTLSACGELCLLLKVAVARGLGEQATLKRLQTSAARQKGGPGLVGRLLSRPKGPLLDPWTFSNVSLRLREKLVFLRVGDADGAQTRRWVRASLCQLDRAPLDGTMLGIYLLEGLARRHNDQAALARLGRWRRRVGRMYRRVAEQWLPRVPD